MHQRRDRFPFLAALLSLLALAAVALGQESRGRIIGQIVDGSGAVIPSAEVKVTNLATNVTVTATTNDEGSYSVPFLLPGEYRVTAERSGFKRYLQDGVEVRVSETVQLNITLEAGGLSETVEVKGQTPLLDTTTPSLGQVIDQRRVQELPIFSGNATELTLLAPGVVNSTDMRLRKAAFNNAPSQISTDGNGTFNNEFTIDGVPNTFSNGNVARVAFSPPVYAIKEFKIQTSAYDASVGHTIGALTNLGTASGTNEFHGEAHLWERNSAFDAPNFFVNRNFVPTAAQPTKKIPVYQDHRYGASIGGPVWIPKAYKGTNKTFFYYAYEGNKWGVPTTFTGTVPTAKQRLGDFSELVGGTYQIYNPFTTVPAAGGRFSREPFRCDASGNPLTPLANGRQPAGGTACNKIPTALLNPVALKLVNLYPLPNQAGTSDGRQNFFSTPKALEDYYVHFARVDHAFSENHRVFGRIHYDWWEEDKNDHFLNRNNALILNRINRGLAFDDVYVINPNNVLNVRYGLTYQEFPERRASQGTDLASLGFSSALTSLVVDPSLATLPRFTAGAYSTVAPWETGDGTNTSMIHSVAVSMTRLQGNHNLKFGTDIRVYRAFGNRFPQSTAPDFAFNSNFTRGPLDNSPAALIGQELAQMLLGIPSGSMARAASYATQDKYFAFYLHDDFKLRRNLTVNAGLRYDLELPMTERFDRLVAGFAFDQSNPLEAAAKAKYALNPVPELPVDQFRVRGGLTFAGANGNGRSPFKGEKNNFMPRLGLAWAINQKTVLRSGYGIFFDTLGVNTTLPIQTGFSQSTPIIATQDNGQTYIATLQNPFPNGLIAPQGAAGGLLTNIGQGLQFFDPNLKHAYSQRFSLGLQRELPGGFVVDAGYVGNRATRIAVTRNYNATPARYLSTLPTRDQATIDFLSRNSPNPFSGLNSVFGANISRGNLLRPFPQFGDINVEEPIGYSWYHSLQSQVEKRFSSGYTVQLAYTWSKAMQATEFLNAADALPTEVISDIDRTHRLAASGIWELPVGKGRRFGNDLPGVVNFFVGNWQLSGVVTIQSGAPLGFGNRIYYGDLRDIVLPKDQRTSDGWFNTAGFVALRDTTRQPNQQLILGANGQPIWVDYNDPCKNRYNATSCPGTPLTTLRGFNRDAAFQLASNIRTFPLRFSGIRGDNQQRWDFSLTKTWPINERFKAQLRAEVFNAWNQTNFNAPNTDPTNTAFGTITNTAGDPRNWQFAFKLTF
jgi:hypothetical protein